MGLDATKPLAAKEMTFKRIRVPGEEVIDVTEVLRTCDGSDWRNALKLR
jgi:2,5-furandicarboxylate decarboxylase 1